LALRHNRELRFDLRFIVKANQHSGYALDAFTYKPLIASKEDLATYPMLTSSLAERLRNFINPFFWITTEKGFSYSEHYAYDVKPAKHLYRGYWQTENYFIDFEDQIRKDLMFVHAKKFDAISIISEIKSCNSVSIHLRRGDYISNPAAAAIYAQCGQDYYHRAIECIMAKVNNPIFFVFSDDLLYARDFFARYGSLIRYVDVTSSPYEDMYAMSCCKHNIVANSTFSWWGGWLNENVEKKIILPINWFVDSSISHDIYPSRCIKV